MKTEVGSSNGNIVPVTGRTVAAEAAVDYDSACYGCSSTANLVIKLGSSSLASLLCSSLSPPMGFTNRPLKTRTIRARQVSQTYLRIADQAPRATRSSRRTFFLGVSELVGTGKNFGHAA